VRSGARDGTRYAVWAGMGTRLKGGQRAKAKAECFWLAPAVVPPKYRKSINACTNLFARVKAENISHG